MALNVGELYATLTLDDGKFSSGLKKIPGEAESAGKSAGVHIAQGIEGEGSKWRGRKVISPEELERMAKAVGGDAGTELGEAIGRSAEPEASSSGRKVGDALTSAIGTSIDKKGDLLSASTLYSSRADFERAGEQLGDSVSDGVRKKTDGTKLLDASTLYSSRPAFERAAANVGEGAGEGLSEGVGGGSAGLGDVLGSGMSKAGPPMLAAAAAVAALVGAALIEGVGMAMDKEVAVDKLSAQLGASGPMAKDYGKIAGKLYAEGYGEGYSDITAAIKAASNNGLILEDMSKAEAEAVTRNLMMVSDVLEQDIGMTSEAVGAMLKNGLAKDSQEAFDILTRGVQQGVDKSGDLMETFQEYSPLFDKLGLDGTIATGLLSQGLKAGARDADFVADALKEFQIRSTDASEASAEGYRMLGMDAAEMTAMMAAGGNDATVGLDMVLRALRETEDPVKRNAAAVALFGTKAEDLGDSLYALDPSTAAAGLGEIAGATDGLGSAYDNAKTKIEGFKRQGMEKLTTFIGEKVIPAVEQFAQSKGFQEWLADVQRFATDVVDWFVRNWPTISATIEVMANHARNVLGLLWDHTKIGIDVFMWLWNNVLSPLASWISGTLVPTVSALVSWIGDKLSPVVQAAADFWSNTLYPALAWVAGFITGTVVPTVEKIRSKFVEIATGIGTKVGEIVSFVTGIPGRIWGVVSTMWNGLRDGITSAKNWVGDRITDIVSTVTGIPGRIGDMGGKLYNAGTALIQGLINGVTDMAGRAVDKIKNVAGDMVDGALGVLGIRSPSRVFMQIGQHTVEGLAIGIERERSSALSALSNVVGSLAPTAVAEFGAASGSSRRGGGASSGSGAASVVVDLRGAVIAGPQAERWLAQTTEKAVRKGLMK